MLIFRQIRIRKIVKETQGLPVFGLSHTSYIGLFFVNSFYQFSITAKEEFEDYELLVGSLLLIPFLLQDLV